MMTIKGIEEERHLASSSNQYDLATTKGQNEA